MRLAKMSDANSVAGVTVRAVTEENIELARTVTDKDGIAQFPKDSILPQARDSKAKSAHLFIADTATGPALQFVEGTSYPSGSDDSRPDKKPQAEIITDRNLYRPGQTVKMKGLVRDVTSTGLAIPSEARSLWHGVVDVHWRVAAGDGDRTVGEGTVPLSPYGGWEADWTVPEKAKLGDYIIDCRVNGNEYQGSTRINV